MCTEFGAKLQEAITARDNDINSFVWKDRTGNTVRLMDMDQNELKKCYRHCVQMLTNKDLYRPGKLEVRKNIQKCWDSCNTELFARYLFHEADQDVIKTAKHLLDYINTHRANNEVSLEDSITVFFNNVPPIFESVTVGKLMDYCFDKLDVLNRKMISDKFIYAQGIWLTEEEKKDLTEYNNGKIRNRMEVVKERLCLHPDTPLRISPTGLSFAEFRSLVQLPALPKITSLSTIALKTLRDKILLLLDNDLDYHIAKWNKFKENIERVAEYKNWDLTWNN